MPGVLIIEHLIKKPTKATQKYDWMNLENTIVWTEWLYIYVREREREREREIFYLGARSWHLHIANVAENGGL